MRILLIMPSYHLDASETQFYSSLPPIGLAYLASILKNGGCEAQIFDVMGREAEITHRIDLFNPDLIGVSCFTSFYPSFARTIRGIRQTYSGPLVVGGPHFAFEDEAIKSLNQLPIDAVIVGEGEHAILKVLEDLPNLKRIYRSPQIADLDSLPFPDWDLLEMKKYNSHQIQIHTSRGCPYDCIYCSSRHVWGRKVRFRSPEKVLDEMDELHCRYGYKTFFFTDDTFVLNAKRVKHFADLLDSRNYRFNCNGRIDLMNDDLLSDLQRAGCFRVDYGVETFVQRIADIINKQINTHVTEKVIRKTIAHSLGVNLYMMLSLPSETLDDMRVSLKKAEEFHQKYGCTIDFQLCRIYPSTPLALKAGLNVENWEKKIHNLRYPNIPIYLEYPLETILRLGGKWLDHERGREPRYKGYLSFMAQERLKFIRNPTHIKEYIREYLERARARILKDEYN